MLKWKAGRAAPPSVFPARRENVGREKSPNDQSSFGALALMFGQF